MGRNLGKAAHGNITRAGIHFYQPHNFNSGTAQKIFIHFPIDYDLVVGAEIEIVSQILIHVEHHGAAAIGEAEIVTASLGADVADDADQHFVVEIVEVGIFDFFGLGGPWSPYRSYYYFEPGPGYS